MNGLDAFAEIDCWFRQLMFHQVFELQQKLKWTRGLTFEAAVLLTATPKGSAAVCSGVCAEPCVCSCVREQGSSCCQPRDARAVDFSQARGVAGLWCVCGVHAAAAVNRVLVPVV